VPAPLVFFLEVYHRTNALPYEGGTYNHTPVFCEHILFISGLRASNSNINTPIFISQLNTYIQGSLELGDMCVLQKFLHRLMLRDLYAGHSCLFLSPVPKDRNLSDPVW